ncbi:uncharacterized protein [Solanum lycopersicum]|uniref:uncharacterized protein n=1 Tax=Solanum lycopersicum TaxID=4081 RepID=UPI0037485543
MNISILLRHSGIWVSDINYEGYKVDGIVVGHSISFVNLKTLILAELEIDNVTKDIEIRYIVEGSSCPLKIKNDMGVKLYFEVKKNATGIGMYPLCIDTTDKIIGDIRNFDCSSGEVICVEGTERDTEALALVESRICDIDYIPELNATNYITDSNSTEVKTGLLYKDKDTLVAVMAKYKIKNNFNFRVKRSDKKSYVLVCFSDQCGWTLKSSCRKKSDVFKVRYFNSEHTCPMRNRILTKVQATIGFISGVTAPKLVNHKRELYGVEISYQQAWRDRERALEMLKGKPSEGYKQMPRYIWMLNKVYPNSYIRMQKTEDNKFMYLFIALRPLIRGFDYCRPVVVVDAAHLGGAYKGTFVSASTLDGAGCILPLAYGVVDTENDCSWTWFFENFKNAFGERENMCIVSDRNESIIKSVVPSSEYIFTVHEAGKRYIVCIERKTCTCGRFQHDEIPCAHAIAVLKHKNVTNLQPYCSDYYKPYALEKTYEVVMVPMPDKEDWNVPEHVLDEIVRPPRYRRLAGRPRKRRKKNADEKITVNNNCCGQCGQEGHNRRTCTFFPKED